MKNFLIEASGWYGMCAILGAYALVSFSLTAPGSLLYQALNATGALGIIAVSYRKRVMQSVWLNIAWLAIALAAIASLLR